MSTPGRLSSCPRSRGSAASNASWGSLRNSIAKRAPKTKIKRMPVRAPRRSRSSVRRSPARDRFVPDDRHGGAEFR